MMNERARGVTGRKLFAISFPKSHLWSLVLDWCRSQWCQRGLSLNDCKWLHTSFDVSCRALLTRHWPAPENSSGRTGRLFLPRRNTCHHSPVFAVSCLLSSDEPKDHAVPFHTNSLLLFHGLALSPSISTLIPLHGLQ